MAQDSSTSDSVPKEVSVVIEDSSDDNEDETTRGIGPDKGVTGSAEAAGVSKKKKSKRSKLKKALASSSRSKDGEFPSNPMEKITPEMLDPILANNPSLRNEVAGMTTEQKTEAVRKMDVSDLMTGMSVTGKNKTNLGNYKFWNTQPVPKFDEPPAAEDGPIKVVEPDQVPKTPRALYDGFEWVTMDLNDYSQLEEVFKLLTAHYIEDEDSTFRLNYSAAFLNWALKSPGWRAEWHVGVRASSSGRLVAFISAIPVTLKVRGKIVKCSEVNFLCIHKKLRDKRLTPVLIEEITRRCNVAGIYQAIYTGAVLLPKPLFEVGFSGLPPNSTKARQVAKASLPSATSLKGLRPMQKKDVSAVQSLLERYMERFDLAVDFDETEVEHWMYHEDSSSGERVIWTYVVEDPSNQNITDFVSFFSLESLVLGKTKQTTVPSAYLYYYGSETALAQGDKAWKDRLNLLINDALILAKKVGFDVFNALTLLENSIFLEQQKFGAGDGQLHYYLYNYRTGPIAGGVNKDNRVDATKRSGVGVVML
ncbi:glycylpeptide N-tetradecanoyltransferase [Agyrium rufum]|nr:glycylpeptide N-tetradecanoyltransferase [Agyrium rufum]